MRRAKDTTNGCRQAAGEPIGSRHGLHGAGPAGSGNGASDTAMANELRAVSEALSVGADRRIANSPESEPSGNVDRVSSGRGLSSRSMDQAENIARASDRTRFVIVSRRGLIATFKAIVLNSLKQLLPAPWYWRFVAWRIGQFDAELHLLRYLCDRSKTSIDVGASSGSYTVHLLNHSAKCHAFEPRPDAAMYLARRLTARPNARLCVEAVALSDRTGVTPLRVVTAETGRSTIEAANPVERAGAIEILTVPTRRLDDYAGIIDDSVGCIKIDVEGHEEAVLRGAARILARDHPSLIIEIEERHKRESISAVRRYLAALGYQGFFFRGGRLHPIESFRLDTHQNVSKILQQVDGESAYVNSFLFFPVGSLTRIRHLIDDR
jgi:FkbM family methyltransferase